MGLRKEVGDEMLHLGLKYLFERCLEIALGVLVGGSGWMLCHGMPSSGYTWYLVSQCEADRVAADG
jgi:hypothetical protein